MHVVAIAISWLDYSAELLSVLTINFSLVATLTYRPSVANDDTRSRIYLSPRLSILPSLLTCILKDSTLASIQLR